MSELAVSLLRLSYLLALWLFVFAALGVLRRDTYGTKILRRAAGAMSLVRKRRVVAPPVPDSPSRPTDDAAPHPQRSARPAAPDSDAPNRLVVVSGPLRGTTLPLGNGLTIGRSATSNLVLDDEFTSGRHALIAPRDGRWYVEDLGSTNGTFVGRQRISRPVPVRIGSTVRIGQTRVELR
ncbi:MAG: FHA domain-containing protein [Bifidobacteriaceae bacterium]|jgi:hypothetical protein|nr:FHA domain-containing protein [Bifidobacteriaceae bacterium]